MAKLTIVFGIVIALIGVSGFLLGSDGLHPLIFGLVLAACGLMAMTSNPKKRMVWMHVAVTIGLLGFLIPGSMSVYAMVKAHSAGVMLAKPTIAHMQLLVAALCLIFVVLCVRSFIAARRSRVI